MHAKRTLDFPEWRHSSYEQPNSLADNSFNPYVGTPREQEWDSTKHKGTGVIVNQEPSFNNNEMSQNSETNKATAKKPKQSSLIQIRIGGGSLDFSKNKQ